MALMNRISKLLKADLHAVIDSIEEPEILLKQAIREMEEELQQERQNINLTLLEQQKLEKSKTDLHQTIDKLNQEMDTCFQSKRDDLARSFIKRKLEAEAMLINIIHRSEALEKSLLQQQKRHQENNQRYRDMRQKAEILADYGEENSDEPLAGSSFLTTHFSISNEQIEVAFLREQKRHDEAKNKREKHS